MKNKTNTKTLQVRIKDKHTSELNRMARVVNFVWNYCNDLSYRKITERGVWMTGFDFSPYTKGSSKELGLPSPTIQAISEEYAIRRKQHKKIKLQWRKSGGSRRSLGWIPFKGNSVKFVNGQVKFNGQHFKIWDSYGLAQYKFRAGSFSQDARGRWYFNVAVTVEAEQSQGKSSVGIDLGCKESVTCSDGTKLVGLWYRASEQALATAQRRKHSKKVKNIHAKIRNRRKDDLHKLSRKLVNNNAFIVVGDVSSKKLVKTKMAKSVNDAGWHMFKTMLEYKCDSAGAVFEVVNESYTTQTCSSCGALPDSRPKGIAGLGIREWTCTECGATHDRDINAAKNILAVGHGRLAVGIPVV